ncbi:hypothetical protein Clacol_002225 [Clathrus columnatus]|uniref:Uncharacterized protein n=1 Tax=Clathrus columnatus TaxID=1419009 RepID=A0AAV5A481_9AGAM|nr:hypothetical protein Clacol_002225 [Clathrus columnatus]
MTLPKRMDKSLKASVIEIRFRKCSNAAPWPCTKLCLASHEAIPRHLLEEVKLKRLIRHRGRERPTSDGDARACGGRLFKVRPHQLSTIIMAPPTKSKLLQSRTSFRNVIKSRAANATFVPSGTGLVGDNEENNSSNVTAVTISILIILMFVGLLWVAIVIRKRIQARRNQLRLQRARVWAITQKERSSSSMDLKPGTERASLIKEMDTGSLPSITVPEYLSVEPPAPPPKAHTSFGKKFHLLAGVFTSQAPVESSPSDGNKRRFSQYSTISTESGPWTRIELQSPVAQGNHQPPQIHVAAPVQPIITRPASIRSHKAEISQSYQVPPWDSSLVIPPSTGINPPPPYSHTSNSPRIIPPLPSITISPATPTTLRAVNGDD